MCQLFALSSSQPVQVGFDWQHFVVQGASKFGNPDGWGVAFQAGNEFHLVREPHTAEHSPAVEFLASHGPASGLVISHVRRATMGEQTLANTQPFQRKLAGRCHLFAHNGHAPIDNEVNSPWLQPVGETDSELLFMDLLQRLKPLWVSGKIPSLDERTAVIKEFSESARLNGAVNFLYTDGITLFAHGHRRTIPGEAISNEPGLYVSQQEIAQPEFNTLCEGLTCYGSASATIVATVPLKSQESQEKTQWRPLECGEIIRIEKGTIIL